MFLLQAGREGFSAGQVRAEQNTDLSAGHSKTGVLHCFEKVG